MAEWQIEVCVRGIDRYYYSSKELALKDFKALSIRYGIRLHEDDEFDSRRLACSPQGWPWIDMNRIEITTDENRPYLLQNSEQDVEQLKRRLQKDLVKIKEVWDAGPKDLSTPGITKCGVCNHKTLDLDKCYKCNKSICQTCRDQ